MRSRMYTPNYWMIWTAKLTKRHTLYKKRRAMYKKFPKALKLAECGYPIERDKGARSGDKKKERREYDGMEVLDIIPFTKYI